MTAPCKDAMGAQARYFTFLSEGRFMIQRCGVCARHVFHPREICPHCGAGDLRWVAPSGAGVVYSTTTVRRKPDAGGDYNVAIVELDEGVRMMSSVRGVTPDAVRIGMRVRATVTGARERALVLFEPAGDA